MIKSRRSTQPRVLGALKNEKKKKKKTNWSERKGGHSQSWGTLGHSMEHSFAEPFYLPPKFVFSSHSDSRLSIDIAIVFARITDMTIL